MAYIKIFFYEAANLHIWESFPKCILTLRCFFSGSQEPQPYSLPCRIFWTQTSHGSKWKAGHVWGNPCCGYRWLFRKSCCLDNHACQEQLQNIRRSVQVSYIHCPIWLKIDIAEVLNFEINCIGCHYSIVAWYRYAVPFLAATKQLYEWFSPSVCLSVHPSHLFDYVPIIVSLWNFQELLPMAEVTSIAKGQGQRSKVKVTEVTTQLSRFRTVTPVWIHIWRWNDTYSFMLLRRGVL